MKRLFKNISGSVMMECVIALPLHLLVLLGTVYLGTLSSDRAALVSVDHFSAFVTESTLAGLKGFYCPDDDFCTFNHAVAVLTPSKNTPYYFNHTRVETERELPVWLQGIGRITQKVFKIVHKENPMPLNGTMAAANDVKGGTSAAVIRNPRYTVNRAVTTDWAGVAGEPFVFGAAPAAVQAKNLSQYNRNPDCETWSVEKL